MESTKEMEQVQRDTMAYLDVAQRMMDIIKVKAGDDDGSMCTRDAGIGMDVTGTVMVMSLPGGFTVGVPCEGPSGDAIRALFDESWKFIFGAIAPCDKPFFPSADTNEIDAAYYVRFKVFEICVVLGYLAGIDVGVDVGCDGWVTMSILLSSGDIAIVAPKESLVPSVLLLPELEGTVPENGLQRKRISIFAAL